MSFVKNIFNKMSGGNEEDDDDTSEEASTGSSDTGIFTTGLNSDLESSTTHVGDADCSQISNFFGYWYVSFRLLH